MSRMLRRTFVVFTLAATGSITSAWAQDTVRVRGTVEGMDGPVYLVKTRSGDTVKVAVTDKPLFVAMVKASMADIKPGMFVGSTAMPGPDGSLQAVEVHIFPEAMRGTGEGHRPYDPVPNSTMTNGTAGVTVASSDGSSMVVKYKDGEKKLLVTPETVVVTYAPGDKAELKPGTGIFIAAAEKKPDGTLLTPRITYGKDGLVPPM